MAKVRELVAEYVAEYGVADTGVIAEYVASNGAGRPAKGTVSVILKELGYSAHRQSPFSWRHNKAHE